MRLVIATRNRHKLAEISEILRIPGVDLLSALDFPSVPDVAEDGRTFEENAVKKAVALALATGLWAMADDSGLEVEALSGAPGINSARFAGKHGDYAANNAKLLKLMEHVQDRHARFRCVVALASPSGMARTVGGVCTGILARESRGHGGFGYDPLFIPDGYTQTFAEMPAPEKHEISHRGRALRKAIEKWGRMLQNEPQDWPR